MVSFKSTALLLASAVSMASATTVWNSGNFDIWVQDTSGYNHFVTAKRNVVINEGWAFIWSDAWSGGDHLQCSGAAFTWPTNYNTVWWTYNFAEGSGYLVDGNSNRIYSPNNQKCHI